MYISSLIKGFGAALLLVVVGYSAYYLFREAPEPVSLSPNEVDLVEQHQSAPEFLLRSAAFRDGESIPSRYTCDAEDLVPPLDWSGVPENTRSLVLIFDDPDVRVNSPYVHWVKFDIPPTVTRVAEGVEPAGVAGSGSSGLQRYFGPCPPDKQHKYFFRLYALDTMLELPEGARKQEVVDAMQGHVLDEAMLSGVYNRLRNR